MRKCIFHISCTPALVFRVSPLRQFIRQIIIVIHEVVPIYVNNIIIILNVFTKNMNGTLALNQLECQLGFVELHVGIDDAQFAGPEHSNGYLHNVLVGAHLDHVVFILIGLDAQQQLLDDEFVAAWIIVGEAVPDDAVVLLVQRDAIELAIRFVHCVDLINHSWPLYVFFFPLLAEFLTDSSSATCFSKPSSQIVRQECQTNFLLLLGISFSRL